MKVCPACKGSKKLAGRPCGNCGGTGFAYTPTAADASPTQTMILTDPDEPMKRIKITCRCKAALLMEVSKRLEPVASFAVLCRVCGTHYILDNGTLIRRNPDGTTKELRAKPKLKETEPSKDSFPATPNKYIN